MLFGRSRLLMTTLLLLGFLVAAIALHFRGFSAPMYCDSSAFLQENDPIFARQSAIDVIRIAPQRPVSMLSFYGNYLFAGMVPFYFRLISAALLALTSLALFFVVLLVLKTPVLEQGTDTTTKQVAALWCSLFFLVHPLHTQTVLYIWQRMALLACMFFLLSFATYLATRLGIIRNRALGFVICGILFLCAILSKENAVTLLPMIVLVELILFKQDFRAVVKLLAPILLAAVLVFVPLAFVEVLPGSREAGIFHMIKLYYHISGLTPLQIALTQARMFFSYLSLSLVPFLLTVPFWVAPIISRSLLNPPVTLLAVASFLAIIGCSLSLLRRRPLTSFGMLFFIINLIPESVLVPTHVFFAYRATLPLVGLALIGADLGIAVWRWAQIHGQDRKVQICLATIPAIWIAVLAVATSSKAALWNDPVRVWKDAARYLPAPDTDFEKMHYLTILDSLGAELQHQGRYAEALQYHERSLQVAPTNMRTLTLMGTAFAGSGDLRRGEIYFSRALKGHATDERARVFTHITYGVFLERTGRKREAADQYVAALELRPDMVLMMKKLGCLHTELGHAAEAEKCFRNALVLEPNSPEAHYDLATALKAEGKLDEAISQYKSTLALKPGDSWAYNNLGRLMEAKGDMTAALECYANALRYNNSLAEAHFNMGNVLARMNKLDEAIRHYMAATTIQPKYAQAHNNVGVALEKKGDLRRAAQQYKLAVRLKPDVRTFSQNLARVVAKLRTSEQAGTLP